MPSYDETTKKPETILFYNKTEIGEDLLHQRSSNKYIDRGDRVAPWQYSTGYLTFLPQIAIL